MCMYTLHVCNVGNKLIITVILLENSQLVNKARFVFPTLIYQLTFEENCRYQEKNCRGRKGRRGKRKMGWSDNMKHWTDGGREVA